jgi:hypothetical protein
VTVAIDIVAALYGWNWAAEVERQTFIRRLASTGHPHFRWCAEPPPAPTALPFDSLDEYTKGLDQEFLLFEYRAESFQPDVEAVLVLGSLQVVTRFSREPFARPFRHRWRQRRGVLVDVARVSTHHPAEPEQLVLRG